jgi:Family of unknown function (DUF5565)
MDRLLELAAAGADRVKKIISLFQRNYEGDRLVRDELVPGAEWVAAGEGQATIKFDGTACMVRAGKLYRRFDAKAGKRPPAGFEPAQEPDPVTGHHPGWVPISETDPGDKWHRLAFEGLKLDDGTYELCGPHFNRNPHGFEAEMFIPHGRSFIQPPRTFGGLKAYLRTAGIEGIVWHHPDGRMVKIKARDFGLRWPSEYTGPE